MKKEKIKKLVKEKYGGIARKDSSCCLPENPCCGDTVQTGKISQKIGYSPQELEAVPAEANLGLGCGNPTAIASLRKGETVLDLGSGAGFDCFLAANRVGSTGKVIGVDMTPEMLDKARDNAQKAGYTNIEFRLGEIESLPVEEDSIDVVISNCVINLSPDKPKVFREAFRVLRPGGRMIVSDLVLLKDLPESIQGLAEAYTGCVADALLKEDYLRAIEEAGFQDVRVTNENRYAISDFAGEDTLKVWIQKSGATLEELKQAEDSVLSISVTAQKSRSS